MKASTQAALLTLGAVALYAALRNMPDTHCSFLHASHEPLVIDGAEFCGEDEEANFYDPATLGFPFALRLEPSDDLSGGSLRVIDEAKRPVPPHLFAVSHTQQLHLHLRQGDLYAHLHPTPSADGTWNFRLPPEWEGRFLGGPVEAYADFQHARSRRTILVSANPAWPAVDGTARLPDAPVVATWAGPAPELREGQSTTLNLRLARASGGPVELTTVMGALGHAVLFSTDGRPGYAHIHPSFTGRERGPQPELAFRLRLPPAGRYAMFVHVADAGKESYARIAFEVGK